MLLTGEPWIHVNNSSGTERQNLYHILLHTIVNTCITRNPGIVCTNCHIRPSEVSFLIDTSFFFSSTLKLPFCLMVSH